MFAFSRQYKFYSWLLLCVLLNRPFVKLKECGGGRQNISRSSSSTSSFSSTAGETEALEELEMVSPNFYSFI